MPNEQLQLDWHQAALELESRLRQMTGQAPERLDLLTIKTTYPRRSWAAAWRVTVEFSDHVSRRIDVVATAQFPLIPVRTALVDHPEFLTWPHVESDGILCLLPNMAEVDPDDPVAVAENLLIRSCRLIEELLQGGIVERDFREEFLTYWAYKAHADGSKLFSLLAPEAPSRVVRVWKGKGIEVVGETAEALAAWSRRRYGAGIDTATQAAAFLWLDTPLLPTQYPDTAADLRNLAADIDATATAVLDSAAGKEPNELLVILGAKGRGGAGLIAVKVLNPKPARSTAGIVSEPLSRGFRPRSLPAPLLAARFFGSSEVIRSSVQRADARWIHGRGQDARTESLLGSTILIIGCGSVGAPVACKLAQAGVGHLILVDSDNLSWPNVGRHPLGATEVGRNKAEALAERLQSDFPHLRIEYRPHNLFAILAAEPGLLDTADLIVVATGSWAAENAINRWHVASGRLKPVLYGWTEAHACAGHAVAIVAEGGCFQCHIGRTGVPSFKVVTWPNGGDENREEPACGAHYQPYGPVELSYITATIADLALDCILDLPRRSLHRIFAASPKRVADLGGRWSDEWLAEHGDGSVGVQTVDREWVSLPCVACGTGSET